MTIGDFLKAKLKRFGFTIEDDELEASVIDAGVVVPTDETNPASVLEVEYSREYTTPMKLVLISLIPELLLKPSISQGDYSEKYDINGIKAYYSLICGQTGSVDIFNPVQNHVVDRSDIW